MFSKDVDHFKYFDENYEQFYEFAGFPFFRLNRNFFNEEKPEEEEKLVLAMNLRSAHMLILSNNELTVYKIPTKDSFMKIAGGKVLGVIPGVSDVMDGIENAKDLGKGVKGLKNWVTGKNKREKLERLEKGLPSKKDFKNVEWKLKKEEGKAMVLSYADYILMANGFHWKPVLKHPLNDESEAVSLSINPSGIEVDTGKKRKSFKYYKDDFSTFSLVQEHCDLIFEDINNPIEKSEYELKLRL